MAISRLNLTRDQLATFLKDHEQIKQFERLFATVDAIAPDFVNEVAISAGTAQATANDALALIEALENSLTADGAVTDAKATLALQELQALKSELQLKALEPAEQYNNSIITDYLTINENGHGENAVGRMIWDDGEGTIDFGLKGGNVVCKIGMQEYVRAYNDTLLTMTKGQIVYISGAQGNRVAVKLAQADSDANSAHTIGIVAETITAGGEGFVQVSGPIYKLNTLGTIAGDTVYLSPTIAGAFTTTKPLAPNHLVIVGFIERVHASVGSIFIKVDNGYELDELHNVRITSVQPNDLLQYDSGGPYWKNVAPSAISIGTATNLAGGAAGSVPYQSGANTTTFLSLGTAGQVLQVNSGATAPEWVSSTGTGNVVRATSPTVPLLIGGTGTTSTLALRSTSGVGTTGADIIFQTGNNGATEVMRLANDGQVLIGTASSTARGGAATSVLTVKPSGSNYLEVQTSASDAGGVVFSKGSSGNFGLVLYAQASEAMTFFTAGSVKMRIDSVGNVGIGTTVASSKLYVAENNLIAPSLTYNAAASFALLGGNVELAGGLSGVSPFPYWLQTRDSTNAARTLAINPLGGDVGIGTTSPAYKLDVAGTAGISGNVTLSGGTANGVAYLNASKVLTTGSALTFDGSVLNVNGNQIARDYLEISAGGSGDRNVLIDFHSDDTYTDYGLRILKGAGANGPTYLLHRGTGEFLLSTVEAAAMTFHTSNTERMRIDSAGNVGIGTTSPTVFASGKVVHIHSASASSVAVAHYTNGTTGATSLDGMVTGLWTDNNAYFFLYENADMLFATNTLERLRITGTGNIGVGTSAPVNKLQINGSLGRNAPVTKTGNFTLADTENWIICNGTGTITVTLPAASSWTGREVMIKTIAAFTVVSASSNVVPLAGGAAGTAILAATAGAWATLVSDGTNWIIMQA